MSRRNRYRLAEINIQADPTVPPTLIADNFPLTVELIVAQRVQGAEAAIALKPPQEGYPFAKIGQRDILLTGQPVMAPARRRSIWPTRAVRRIETTGDLASMPSMSRCSPGSNAANCTTVARSTICGRRWWRPGCSRPSRRNRKPTGERLGRYRICDDAGNPAGWAAADAGRQCRLWHG